MLVRERFDERIIVGRFRSYFYFLVGRVGFFIFVWKLGRGMGVLGGGWGFIILDVGDLVGSNFYVKILVD